MLLSINTHIIDKPSDAHRSAFNKPFESHDLTPDALMAHIKNGHAFSAQFHGQKRKSNNFAGSGFLAADIDKGMTLAEALALPFVQQFAAFVYTTASHTEEANRFRIVFELEAPIFDGSLYRATLTGLIARLGGDESCKDAARLFYGFRGAHTYPIGKTLPSDEVIALVASGKKTQSPASGISTKNRSTIRTEAPFDADQLVTTADGNVVPLSAFTQGSANKSIHCPFHNDKRASALVVFGKSGDVGIFCHSCAKTAWITAPRTSIDFDWHLPYQRMAEQHLYSWSCEDPDVSSKSCIAEDGTSVWLFDDRHLPSIPLSSGLTYIRSPKGSGKTVQLSAIVKKLKQQGKSILLIGHRRLLLSSLARKLGLPFYMKSGSREDLESTGCIAVSLESLPNFVDPKFNQFDAVIIDESEQVISHFTSKTCAHNRLQVFGLLEHIVKKAEYVICADADVGLLTSGFFYLTRNETHPNSLIINQYRPSDDSTIADTDPNAPISTIEIYNKMDTLLSLLDDDVRRGARCFVATNSKKMAELIEFNLKHLYPDKALLLVTSATSDRKEVKKYTRHPETETANYGVVICSPALGTGVDISFQNASRMVDRVYGIFKDRITTHFEIDQQLSRVRNPGAVRVWISDRRIPLETEPNVIHEELVKSRDAAQFVVGYSDSGNAEYTDNKVLDLVAWIISIRRASLSNLKGNFISLREQNGWTVKFIEHAKQTSWQKKVLPDERRIAQICEAADIDRKGYSWIETRAKGFGLDHEESAQKRKYELQHQYDLQEITPDLVVLDDDGAFAIRYAYLELLYLSRDKLARNDRQDLWNMRVSSIDWPKRILKKDLIEKLLSATGLFKAGDGFIFEAKVSKDSLAGFVTCVSESKGELSSLLELTVRGDLREKPVIQLREILHTIGMKLTRMERSQANGVATGFYRVDRNHWEHVVTTCGMKSDLIDRQRVIEQIDIG